ncbi:MAG: small conductance mechanosensitive channel MscS [Rhodobacteraceae bacterium HLUCCA12]|nr:MAG: small conductance mechanosensitive channel MscS [Rhodobacteraceae bacterium HLUCCA12]
MVLFRLLLLWLVFATPIQAQSLLPSTPGAESNDTEQDAAATLAEILRDDAAREALIEQLESAAEESGAAETAQSDDTGEPMSLARQLAEYTRDTAEEAIEIGSEIAAATQVVVEALTDGPGVDWAEFSGAAIALVLVGAVTLALFFVLRAIGLRIFRRLAQRRAQSGWLMALVLIVVAAVIDALIIVLAWQGGYAFALFLGEAGSMDFRQSMFLNAFLIIEITKVILRAVLSPRFGSLRFAPMRDETAAYWYFWSSRLVSLLGYGLLLVVPILNAAVSNALGQAVAVLVVITALLIAVLIVMQNRRPVAQAMRARSQTDPNDTLGKALAFFAGFWHWLAIIYLVALFVIWASRPADALQFMLVSTLQSVVAVVLGIAAMALIARAITGGLHLPDEVSKKLPLLEGRLNAFVPSILKVVRVLVVLAVLIAVAQSWQVLDFLGWVASEVGRNTVGRLVSAALVVLFAMVIWLAVSSFIEYRLNPGVGRIVTARERTLLALFRNAFTIGLLIIAVMLTLSEIGVNIAPLLAGAGVLGLAIGFGAQKLVQDIITGAFIQFENAMNEGDFVTAGGISGMVEKLTIRSVGLRDAEGTYHLIPFSSVDMVSNFMKGFAYHIAEVGVAYRENIAEVKEHMKKAFDILQSGELADEILEPLDIQGVSALGDSAVVVRARIKTKPGMQWAVGRAYNEIIKDVLDEAGVEIPYPHMTIYMGQDKDGRAPALNLRPLETETSQEGQETASDAPRRSDSTTRAPSDSTEAANRRPRGSRTDEIERTIPDSDDPDEN